MAPDGRAFASYFWEVLVHDVLGANRTVITGYVRLLLRDFVVGQDWTPIRLRHLQEVVKAAEVAERRLAAFQRMADAKDLLAAARSVADYYADYGYGDERLLAFIPDGTAGVPVPFPALPFVLCLLVQRQPGVGLAPRFDYPPPYVALTVNLSDAEIEVSVEPTRSRAAWCDETARAAGGMGWIADVYAMVEASNGTFGIFTNADYQMRAVMHWKRTSDGDRSVFVSSPDGQADVGGKTSATPASLRRSTSSTDATRPDTRANAQAPDDRSGGDSSTSRTGGIRVDARRAPWPA